MFDTETNENTEVTPEENSEASAEQEFDQAFDEFADSSSSEESDSESGRPRDEMGRFTAADNSEGGEPAEEEPEELPEAAETKPQENIDWEHRFKSEAGRQRALQQKVSEREQTIAQLQQRLQHAQQPAPAGNNPEQSGMSDAEWGALKEQFPEIARGLEARLSGVSQQYESKFQQQQQTISELQQQMQPMQKQAHESYRSAQFQILEQQHPDYQDVAGSGDFQYWLNQQPGQIQQLMGSDNAADAAYLIGTYKQHKAATAPQTTELEQRRQRKLQSAQTVPARSGNKKPVAEDDLDAAFDYFADRA